MSKLEIGAPVSIQYKDGKIIEGNIIQIEYVPDYDLQVTILDHESKEIVKVPAYMVDVL